MRINLADILYRVLNESVRNDQIIDVINNRNYVDLNYVDEDGSAVGNRLVQVYAYGRNKSGNSIIRVFQVSGDSLRKREWKTLRLDRIISWKPRRQTFSVPPEAQGYNVPAYREDGDNSMSIIYAQVQFGFNDTLDKVRRQTQHIANAPKITQKQKIGPVPYASQQRKKNIYTSQPNSEKYKMYQRNVNDTENAFDRFNNDIWAQAEAEKAQQDSQRIQSTAPKPPVRNDGPLREPNKIEDLEDKKNG